MTTVAGISIASGVILEREEAFAALHEAHSEARTGTGRVVLVGGEAGVGKTTLVRGFCDAVGTNARVLAGLCDPISTPRPFGPFLDVVENNVELTALARGGVRPHNLFDALRPWLAEQQTILVLEDLHWGDEASLDVVRLLTRRIETLPVLVLATYRDDALTRLDPMQILLGDLATSSAVTRLSLDTLSCEAVRSLALGHDVDPEALHRSTGGNPFFVTQALAAAGAELPATVRDAVLARCAGLEREGLDLLEVVALSPPRAEPWLLAAVSGDLADLVEDCLSTGLVQSDDRGVSFRHELGRLAVAEATTLTRRRTIHRRVLAALAEQPGTKLDHARLAHHAEAAEDEGEVLRHAPSAARQASAAGAYREAAAHYARALRFADGLEPGERAGLLEGQARACYLADDQVEAIAVIREAIRCRQEQRDPVQEARALAELSDYLKCRGIFSEANAALRRAADLVSGEPEQREHAYVLYAAGRFGLVGGNDAAIEFSERAIEIAERFDDEYTAGHARVTLATAIGQGDLDAGLALLAEAAELAELQGQTETVVRAFSNMGSISLQSCRFDLADAYLESGLERCAEHTSDLWRINMLALSALSFLAQGRFDDAARRAAAILEDPRESPAPHHAALMIQALARARRGDPGAHDALAAIASVEIHPDDVETHVETAETAAEIAWLESRPEAISEATDAILQTVIADGAPNLISRLAFWRRLAGIETDVPEDATGPHALALSGEWALAAAEWARRGQPYEAAFALAQSGDVVSLRKAHEELQRLGALPAARLASQRLRALGVRGLARGTESFDAGEPAGLTAREVAVLALLADGLRNAQIAERLVVSPRTVDHHVSAILRKLEAATRGEAVARAGELGLLAA